MSMRFDRYMADSALVESALWQELWAWEVFHKTLVSQFAFWKVPVCLHKHSPLTLQAITFLVDIFQYISMFEWFFWNISMFLEGSLYYTTLQWDHNIAGGGYVISVGCAYGEIYSSSSRSKISVCIGSGGVSSLLSFCSTRLTIDSNGRNWTDDPPRKISLSRKIDAVLWRLWNAPFDWFSNPA